MAAAVVPGLRDAVAPDAATQIRRGVAVDPGGHGSPHGVLVLGEGFDTGDGTVPYRSARPTFLPETVRVLVSPEDGGYWEQFHLRWFSGLHGLLPRMNRLVKLSAAFLNGEGDERAPAHPGIQGRPPIGVDEADWGPPFEGLEAEG